MIKLFAFTLVAATAFTIPALADSAKKARDNDVVDEYILKEDGKLVRQIGSLHCDVSTNVKSFKISQHPQDAAVVYYVRNEKDKATKVRSNNLYYLKNAAGAARKSGECPTAEKGRLMVDVKEYTVVPSEKTKIVNMALSSSGQLLAWPNSGQPLINTHGIRDLAMNACNDQAGFSFKKYVAFAERTDGRILKVEGDKPEDSAATPESFASINEFKKDQNVCKQNRADATGGNATLDVL